MDDPNHLKRDRGTSEEELEKDSQKRKRESEYDEEERNTDCDEQQEEEEEDDDDDDETDRYWPPPVEESLQLIGSRGLKTVSAFAFNNSGSRFAAGGFDHQVKIWDFDALDPARPDTIYSNEPCGQTIIKQLDYSLGDELILVIPTSCQATIMAADGLVDQKNGHCVKGDQYLSDMTNTKGHVNMLNDGCWSPKDREAFITCSQDSTVRIWDVSRISKQQTTVIKTRSPMGGLKCVPTSCKFSRDSLSIVAGCSDGTIMFWDTRRKFITTSACIKSAHAKGSEISGLDYSYGANKLCSRSEDGSCKIWDLRQLRPGKPLVARQDSNLDTVHSADCCFSPDDRLIMLGTSAGSKSTPGQVLFLDTETLQTQSSLEMKPGVNVIRSRWHPKINHLGFSCSDGMVNISYDKRRSMGGLLDLDPSTGNNNIYNSNNQNNKRGLNRRKKYMAGPGSGESSFVLKTNKIITPHSLPLFREDSARKDPRRAYRPEMPAGAGGASGSRGQVAGLGQQSLSAGSTLSSYIARNLATKPREGSGHHHVSNRERQPQQKEQQQRSDLKPR